METFNLVLDEKRLEPRLLPWQLHNQCHFVLFVMYFSVVKFGYHCFNISRDIAILTVTSPIVINVPTRGLLAVETKDSFVLWLAKFKYQKTCL